MRKKELVIISHKIERKDDGKGRAHFIYCLLDPLWTGRASVRN